ncbi:MAG: DUF2062 domain-containing protein, partial [Flavitalea sp.]
QMGTAIFMAILFRLNKPLVIIAANLSIPPMIPLIIFASYKIGGLWMGTNAGNLKFSSKISLELIRNNFEQYLYGSISLAILAALVSGLLTFLLLKLLKRKPILAG